MIGPLLSLIYLFTYSDIGHVLVGSRRHFCVDMGYCKEGQLLIGNLYVFKGYETLQNF